MDNLHQLNRHIRQKPSAAVKLQIPELLKTATEQDFFRDDNGDVWRALSFITNSESLEILSSQT